MSNCVECGDTLITGLNGDMCLSCLHEEEHEQYVKEESVKYDLKHDLANVLNSLKGFEVGYTSKTNDAIIVEHNGNVFKLSLEYIDYLTLEGAVNEL